MLMGESEKNKMKLPYWQLFPQKPSGHKQVFEVFIWAQVPPFKQTPGRQFMFKISQ